MSDEPIKHLLKVFDAETGGDDWFGPPHLKSEKAIQDYGRQQFEAGWRAGVESCVNDDEVAAKVAGNPTHPKISQTYSQSAANHLQLRMRVCNIEVAQQESIPLAAQPSSEPAKEKP